MFPGFRPTRLQYASGKLFWNLYLGQTLEFEDDSRAVLVRIESVSLEKPAIERAGGARVTREVVRFEYTIDFTVWSATCEEVFVGVRKSVFDLRMFSVAF